MSASSMCEFEGRVFGELSGEIYLGDVACVTCEIQMSLQKPPPKKWTWSDLD